MTPKEKAKQLIEKIDVQVFSLERGWQTDKEQTRDIALICANETFKALIDAYPSKDKPHTFIEYWQKVKEHINEL